MQHVVSAQQGMRVKMDNNLKGVLRDITQLQCQHLALLAQQALNVLLKVWGPQQHALWDPTLTKQDSCHVQHVKQGTAVWGRIRQHFAQLDSIAVQGKQAVHHVDLGTIVQRGHQYVSPVLQGNNV